MTRKILTCYAPVPGPSKDCDWSAWHEGDEELGFYGYGATQSAAIDDLLSYEDQNEAVAGALEGDADELNLIDFHQAAAE